MRRTNLKRRPPRRKKKRKLSLSSRRLQLSKYPNYQAGKLQKLQTKNPILIPRRKKAHKTSLRGSFKSRTSYRPCARISFQSLTICSCSLQTSVVEPTFPVMLPQVGGFLASVTTMPNQRDLFHVTSRELSLREVNPHSLSRRN
jgi:hypothetical protein